MVFGEVGGVMSQTDLDFEHPGVDKVRMLVGEAFAARAATAAGRKPPRTKLLPTHSVALSQQTILGLYRLVASLRRLEGAGQNAWRTADRTYLDFYQYLEEVHGISPELYGDLRDLVLRDQLRREKRRKGARPTRLDPYQGGPIPF